MPALNFSSAFDAGGRTSGCFCVRFRVPGDLRDTLGLTVIKRATGMTCPRHALACMLAWQARHAAAFDAFRRGGMGAESAKS